jgi:hypothetical protein
LIELFDKEGNEEQVVCQFKHCCLSCTVHLTDHIQIKITAIILYKQMCLSAVANMFCGATTVPLVQKVGYEAAACIHIKSSLAFGFDLHVRAREIL